LSGISSTVTITNSVVTHNEATGGDGVIINGGGIDNFNMGFNSATNLPVISYFFNTAAQPAVDNSSLSLCTSTLVGNVAQGGSGGAAGTGGNGLGGGLAINPGSTATVANSVIDSNRALGGSGGIGGDGVGGGVYNDAVPTGFTKDSLTAIDFNFASTSHHNIYP
jgi:hypothetical protein